MKNKSVIKLCTLIVIANQLISSSGQMETTMDIALISTGVIRVIRFVKNLIRAISALAIIHWK